MSLGNRIIKRLFGAQIDAQIELEVMDRLKAANITDEEEGWKRLTGDPERRLNEVTQERMFEICYWLWKYNPLGNWLIEIVTAFVVGSGFTIESDNDEVQKRLNGFWNDPLNDMKIYAEKHVRELGIFGEQCWSKFVSEHSGKVRLGYIDPAKIKKVITDPENVKMKIAVLLTGTAGTPGRKLKTVLPPDAEDVLSETAKKIRDASKDGECYFFSINNVTNDPRGTSDLFVLADWLDAYEQFLYDYAERWPLMNSFVWDLIVEGGDETDIKNALKNFTKKSGSIYGHNEKQKLTAVSPDLKAVDANKGASLLRNHILGNKSIPEHWYGGGGDVNRATAMEMGTPVFKMLNSRQELVMGMFTYVLNDVMDEIDAAGMIAGVPDDEKKFKISTPELAGKDITGFASAIQQLSTALSTAQQQEWIDKDTAVKLFAFTISLIGYEMDVDAIKERLAEDGETKGFEDYLKDGGDIRDFEAYLKDKENKSKNGQQGPLDKKEE